jgi:hypothetical protein
MSFLSDAFDFGGNILSGNWGDALSSGQKMLEGAPVSSQSLFQAGVGYLGQNQTNQVNSANMAATNQSNMDIARMNELDQATKKFHRSLELHKKIEEIQQGEITGYIYEKITKGTWRLYFPDLGFFKIRVVDTKLEHLIDESLAENYVVGQGYPFLLHKKEGFLPQVRLIIVPKFNLLLQ